MIHDILDRLNLISKSYWAMAGTAMVLHAIKEKTSDIDLACDKELAQYLESKRYLYELSNGIRHFKIEDGIEILRI